MASRLHVHAPTPARDLTFFLACFAGGVALGLFDAPHWRATWARTGDLLCAIPKRLVAPPGML